MLLLLLLSLRSLCRRGFDAADLLVPLLLLLLLLLPELPGHHGREHAVQRGHAVASDGVQDPEEGTGVGERGREWRTQDEGKRRGADRRRRRRCREECSFFSLFFLLRGGRVVFGEGRQRRRKGAEERVRRQARRRPCRRGSPCCRGSGLLDLAPRARGGDEALDLGRQRRRQAQRGAQTRGDDREQREGPDGGPDSAPPGGDERRERVDELRGRGGERCAAENAVVVSSADERQCDGVPLFFFFLCEFRFRAFSEDELWREDE